MESTARSTAPIFTARCQSLICRRAVPAISLPPHYVSRRAAALNHRMNLVSMQRRRPRAAAAPSATEPKRVPYRSKGDSRRRSNDSRRLEVSTSHRWNVTHTTLLLLLLPSSRDATHRWPMTSACRSNGGKPRIATLVGRHILRGRFNKFKQSRHFVGLNTCRSKNW